MPLPSPFPHVIGAAAALLLLGGLALAALLARRIEQPIQALVAPALALGRGEPVAVPPLRLREAHQLGHALATAGQLFKAREQERDRAEAQLRESEARFRVLADSAPVMIWMSGGDKVVSTSTRSGSTSPVVASRRSSAGAGRKTSISTTRQS